MENKDRYNKIIRTPIIEKNIKAFIPKPTDKDYNRGFIRRYFLQKTNDKGSPIYELSSRAKGQFINNPLYVVVDVKWRIRGPKDINSLDSTNTIVNEKTVQQSNSAAIKLVGHLMPNLKLYLPNLLQFYKS